MNTLESIYEELQTPILIAALFFLFQLPFIRKKIHKLIPSFFNSDGNYNLSGNLFNCIIFAGSYYGLSKGMGYLK